MREWTEGRRVGGGKDGRAEGRAEGRAGGVGRDGSQKLEPRTEMWGIKHVRHFTSCCATVTYATVNVQPLITH